MIDSLELAGHRAGRRSHSSITVSPVVRCRGEKKKWCESSTELTGIPLRTATTPRKDAAVMIVVMEDAIPAQRQIRKPLGCRSKSYAFNVDHELDLAFSELGHVNLELELQVGIVGA
jgi:hypothetical protein